MAAGQEVLAMGEGTGIYTSFLLLDVAGMIISDVMLRSNIFSKATAYVGILASAFDLAYCIAFPFLPAADADLVAICTIPAAGLLLMIWHILIGRRLYMLGRAQQDMGGVDS